jgi:cobalamin biosynthesis protein CobC
MEHGGDLSDAIARFGGEATAWLDLSTGINPTPWPVPDNLLKPFLQRLPARADEEALLDAAREAYRVPDHVGIVAAPGTQALIQWLPRLAPAGAVAIATPTYSEHARAWAGCGHDVLSMDGFDVLPADARHAVIVNPNNPDGCIAPLDAIKRIATPVRERGGWLVVDEAFVDVIPDATAASLCAELPLIILRSFGKFYGLAGLRLGFAVAAPATIELIRNALGPWSVAGPALAVGAAALRDAGWAGDMRQRLGRQAERLDAILKDTGGNIVGGTSLFRLLRHPDAARIHTHLAQKHIWTRKFTYADDLLRFGLPGTDRDFARLSAALAQHGSTPPPRER